MKAEQFDDQESLWDDNYTRAARFFTPTLAIETILDLQSKLEEPREYVPTDYHWLLIYSILETEISYLNDGADEDLMASIVAAKCEFDYFIQDDATLCLEEFVESHFWDIDFLFGGSDLDGLSQFHKETLRLGPEVFGISQGMLPHPDELRMQLWSVDE